MQYLQLNKLLYEYVMHTFVPLCTETCGTVNFENKIQLIVLGATF